MELRLCANIDLKQPLISEKNMKALIIIDGQNVSDEEIKYLSGDSFDSIQRIAPNSFLFDLDKSAHILAKLQGYVDKITNTYHIFYFKDEVDVFKLPAKR